MSSTLRHAAPPRFNPHLASQLTGTGTLADNHDYSTSTGTNRARTGHKRLPQTATSGGARRKQRVIQPR